MERTADFRARIAAQKAREALDTPQYMGIKRVHATMTSQERAVMRNDLFDKIWDDANSPAENETVGLDGTIISDEAYCMPNESEVRRDVRELTRATHYTSVHHENLPNTSRDTMSLLTGQQKFYQKSSGKIISTGYDNTEIDFEMNR